MKVNTLKVKKNLHYADKYNFDSVILKKPLKDKLIMKEICVMFIYLFSDQTEYIHK